MDADRESIVPQNVREGGPAKEVFMGLQSGGADVEPMAIFDWFLQYALQQPAISRRQQ